MRTVNQVKSVMVQHRITQQRVADKMNITQPALQRLLTRSPSENSLRRINKAIDEIIVEDYEEYKSKICSYCDGTGEVNGKQCKHCGGTGIKPLANPTL